MSIAITRANIKAWFATGEVPAAAQFQSMIDAFPMKYKETVDLVSGVDYTITHGNAEKAVMVQVLDSAGAAIAVTWKQDPADLTNKVIINAASNYTGAQVTVLT